ncbi:MAG TPA: SUMF1/EgtB/PvdO family nonheme iron enzyme [Phycisphaerae bacterium]|nr:SUMF1/EgtB/PvdO family nonheme iron enzyme [Phycisphaerae bacterium]HRY71464.1 SUMF1/EgtB/PvdO family nonheme iron enzyme [Phycisphaerae bacterium]HSA30000.1 SUMF1/EgtB/PvdO family nonheme iron enzyme [Phycisphaerae bacterium]
MSASKARLPVCVLVGLLVSTVSAVTIQTVPVGNPGNVGELSGEGAGGYGPDRICGAVDYTYNVGMYEVTAGQYTAFLNAVAGVDTYWLYNRSMSRLDNGSGITRSGGGTVGNPYIYSVASDFANRPVNYVSYWDCCRFANWLHNGQPGGAQGATTTERGAYTLDGYNGFHGWTIQRNAGWKWAVTSEDEWYKAAYYKGGATNAGYWDYPTSSDAAPGRDMTDASGNNANQRTGSGPYPIDSGKYTTVVGEFQNSDSPHGTFDQGGNVWEWNEAIVSQDATYAYRGWRGGAFYNSGYYLLASYRSWRNPAVEDNSIGFRVVQVPEPAAFTLLVLGGWAVIRRRRSTG